MKIYNSAFLLLVTACCTDLVGADPPGILSHQGRIAVNGANYDGVGRFKFSLVKDVGQVGEVILWHQDGTVTTEREPATALDVTVVKGNYAVLLGEMPAMTSIPGSVFSDSDHVSLRIWFKEDGGASFEKLIPDRRITSVGYAMVAKTATVAQMAESVADGAISSANLADGSVTGSKLADGAVTVAKLFDGSISAAKFESGLATQWNSIGPDISFTNGKVSVLSLELHQTTETDGIIWSGTDTLLHTYGVSNVFVGIGAGNLTMSGKGNSAFGSRALNLNTIGQNNTAIGHESLAANAEGDGNTAVGQGSLSKNTTGFLSTALGIGALYENTTGFQNTALGGNALRVNETGFQNVGVGGNALTSNSTGSRNTAVGENALKSSATGGKNTAVGHDAMQQTTIGEYNTALGQASLFQNTTGGDNIALGYGAGENLTTGDNNIVIGNAGLAGESSTIRLGDADQDRTFIAGIRGIATDQSDAVPVVIDSNGQLGTAGGMVDTDPANEIQTLSLLGNQITLSLGGGTITLSDNDASNELQTIALSGTTVTMSNSGGAFSINDADADPSNELQTISLLGNTVTLSSGGGSFSIQDADADPTNELQTVSLSGSTVTMSGGGGAFSIDDADADATNELQSWATLPGIPAGFADNIDHVDDEDANPANELQLLSLSGNSLSLSNDGGNVSLTEVGPWSISGSDITFQSGAVKVALLDLPATTATDGIITIGGERLIHSFGGTTSFFAGRASGNLTQSGAEQNTGLGVGSLNSVTNGDDNTAIGFRVLEGNTEGLRNTGVGVDALLANVGGDDNDAFGRAALLSNQAGSANTALGQKSLRSNVSGSSNVGVGFQSLLNSTGNANIALGRDAGIALTTGNHNITIGNAGVAGESATIRLGDSDQNRAFIAGIRGITTAQSDALPVMIDSNGQLGTAGGVIDLDPTNELQSWNNLPGIPAGFADGIDHVDDSDADSANEIQSLSLNGTDLTLSMGGGTVSVNDADSDPLNEIQMLSLIGSNLQLSGGGGEIDLGGKITSTMLAAGAVTSDKIAAGAVSEASIADGAVTANKLAAGLMTPKIWSGGPSGANRNTEWQILKLDSIEFNTGSSHFSVSPTGEITILEPGFYEFHLVATRKTYSSEAPIKISRTPQGGVKTLDFKKNSLVTDVAAGYFPSSDFHHIDSYSANDVIVIELYAVTPTGTWPYTTNYDAFENGNSKTRLQIHYLGPN